MKKNGKCVSQGIKSAACREGIYMDKRGDGLHDCRKKSNWKSKKMMQEQQCKWCKVSCIIMDDDTATMDWLKQNINSDIVKRSDRNYQSKQYCYWMLLLTCMKKRWQKKMTMQ